MFNLLIKAKSSQISGVMLTIPKIIMIAPDIIGQVLWGIFIKAVLTFNSNVKRMMERPSDAVIIIAFRFEGSPVIDEPTITGRSGKTHGARTVSTPAINESISKIINNLLC